MVGCKCWVMRMNEQSECLLRKHASYLEKKGNLKKMS